MVKTVVGATSEDLVWVHGPTICTPTDVKSKEATFAVISMIADAQLRRRDVEDFCNNPYSNFNHFPGKKATVLAGSH